MTHFHCAIRKYGVGAFEWKILEMGENGDYGKNVAEPLYIAWLKPEYNKTKGGDGIVGYKHTPEHCLAQSERKRGKKYALGHRHTEETKRIIAEASRSRKRTPEQNKAASIRMMGKKMGLGHKKSEECKRLMSEKMKGRTGISHSKERKLKSSERMKGNQYSLGVKHSKEQNLSKSSRQKGRKQMLVRCPHCEKSGGHRNMKRWHFDNCKQRTGV
jgi:hypothetical protein